MVYQIIQFCLGLDTSRHLKEFIHESTPRIQNIKQSLSAKDRKDNVLRQRWTYIYGQEQTGRQTHKWV